MDQMSVDSSGFPVSDGTTAHPLVQMSNPDQTTQGGFIASLEAYASSALHAVESGAEAAITTTYNAGKTVASDIAHGAENIVGFGVSQIVLVVAVLGVAIYFAGKSGALRITR